MAAAFPRVRWLGDQALIVEFGERIEPEANVRALAFARYVREAAAAGRVAALAGLTDVVPAYASVALAFAREAGAREPIERCVRALVEDAPPRLSASRRIRIPVVYGGDAGPDLDSLAAAVGLASDEVVARHAAPEYRVAMVGFLPGFPYLLGLDPALALPRRATPRPHVPAGSVAIGGAQTGVYPVDAPGGWHLLGRTPARLFDPQGEVPVRLRPGDRLRFVPVDAKTGARLLPEVEG